MMNWRSCRLRNFRWRKGILARGVSKVGSLFSKNPSDHVYDIDVVMVPFGPGWPVPEMEWQHMRRFLKARTVFGSMPDDCINARLHFPESEMDPTLLMVNPSLRVRKGKKVQIAPATIAKPKNIEIYIICVNKLSLLHMEREFAFNLVTWPLSNTLPLLVGGLVLLTWSFFDGWQFHNSNDFLPAIAIAASLTGLSIAIWRLAVQESEKRYDSACRRIENEMTTSSLRQLNRTLSQMSKKP